MSLFLFFPFILHNKDQTASHLGFSAKQGLVGGFNWYSEGVVVVVQQQQMGESRHPGPWRLTQPARVLVVVLGSSRRPAGATLWSGGRLLLLPSASRYPQGDGQLGVLMEHKVTPET